MFKVRTVQVPPSLIRGRVRRLVETSDGVVMVQVWSGCAWEAEPSVLISHDELRRGLDAPPRILRALGVPETDWDPAMRTSQPLALLALLPLLDWVSSHAGVGLALAS